MGLPSRLTADAVLPHHRPAIRKIDQFVDSCGRDRFLAALSLTAQTDDRLDSLLQILEDPHFAGRTVGEVALSVGFRAGELIKIIKETALLVATAHSLQIVADHLPAIVQDTVTRAQNHYEQCQICDGVGKVTPDPTREKPNPEAETCKPCKGRGQVLIAADPERQDRIFEIAKLLPKGGGTNIAVGVNSGAAAPTSGAAAMGSLFSQLVAATDRIVHPDRSPLTAVSITHPASPDAIDAEVVLPSGPMPPAESSEDTPRAGH